MKKLLLILLLIFTAVLNTGCTKKSPDVTAVTTGLKFTLETSIQNKSYIYDVEIDQNGKITAVAVMPEKIKGLKFVLEKDKAFAEFKGLKTEIEANNGIIPQFYETLEDIRQNGKVYNNEGQYKISGEAPVSYCLFIAQTGLPLKLETDSGLVFYFKNVSLI